MQEPAAQPRDFGRPLAWVTTAAVTVTSAVSPARVPTATDREAGTYSLHLSWQLHCMVAHRLHALYEQQELQGLCARGLSCVPECSLGGKMLDMATSAQLGGLLEAAQEGDLDLQVRQPALHARGRLVPC